MANLSLYIHIPFCKKKCKYCDFVSFQSCSDSVQNDYVNLLCQEIEDRKTSDKVVSIFLGGGTPSLLSEDNIKKIFDKIYSCYNVEKNAEITIEVNPNSVSQTKLKVYKQVGINRISVGVQSLNDGVLQILGRLHSSSQALDALKLIKEEGFENVNVDVMFGVVKLTKQEIEEQINNLFPYVKHISTYMLILEENTPLFNLVKRKEVCLPSEEETIKQYEIARKCIQKLGLKRYELSNYALKGFESAHNSRYWNFSNYFGFGISAHSFYNDKRFWNPSNFNDYKLLIKNKSKNLEKEELSIKEKKEEFIMLSLRLKDGINIQRYKDVFNQDLLEDKKEQINLLVNNKLIKVSRSNLKPTEKGLKILNQIILKLID